MLYVTTRIGDDAYTANWALSENRGPGGGFYLPLRMPKFSRAEIEALGEKSFAENVADIVNLLFNTQLDGWAVEFGIGRYPVKLVSISGRAAIAETWHNPVWRFERLARGIEKAVRQSDQISPAPTDWLMIASRIAVLFGIFGELMQGGAVSMDAPVDVAVAVGNFSAPMAAWYARDWGLPIGNIVVCCNENGSVWNLLHKGEIRTDAVAARTATPDCDFTVPTDMERLIFSTLGKAQTERFCETCRKGGTFYLEPHQMQTLRKGMYVTVMSQQRLESAIPNLYKTDGYIADPYTALAYSGLMDYRSRTGEFRNALILSDESPAFSLNLLSKCMGISSKELKNRIDKA